MNASMDTKIGSTDNRDSTRNLYSPIIILSAIGFIIVFLLIIYVLSDWILSHQIFIVLCVLSAIAGFGVTATDDDYRPRRLKQKNRETTITSDKLRIERKFSRTEVFYYLLFGPLMLFMIIAGIIFGFPIGFFSVMASLALGIFLSMAFLGAFYIIAGKKHL